MTVRSVEAELFYVEEKRKDGRTEGQTGRQTDRPADIHEEVNTRFLLFCESAEKAAHL